MDMRARSQGPHPVRPPAIARIPRGHATEYAFLLESFTDPKSPTSQRLPIIRTESSDRMLASATNFALGLFGWTLDGKALMEVAVEEKG